MKNDKGFAFVGLLVTVLVIAGIVAAGWYVKSELDSKDNEIGSLNNDLQATESDLDSANQRVEELDSPERKARDVQRQNDLARLSAELTNYSANNNGQFPSTLLESFNSDFGLDFFAENPEFNDPNTGNQYTITTVANVQTPPGLVLGDIQYQWPGKCAGSEFDDDASTRQAAIRILLESGETVCQDV